MPHAVVPVVPVEEARSKLGTLIRAAANDGEVTVLSLGGVKAAAIVPLAWLAAHGKGDDEAT